MGEGADMADDGPPQNGGEYYGGGGGGMATPVPGPWGPQAGYDPRYAQPAPVYQAEPLYQHPQPPPEYRQAPAPTPVYQRPPPRRRKASKGMQRMYLVQYYEAVLESPIFGDPNDPYANQVQAEMAEFAQRRIDELLGEAPERSTAQGLEQDEVQVLKALARRMLEPEPAEVEEAPPAPPENEPEPAPAPPPAPAPRPPAPRPPLPQRPAQAAPPAPRPPPPPAPRVLPPLPQMSAPPPMGPRVIARATPGQQQRMEQAPRPPVPRPPMPNHYVGPAHQPPAQIVHPGMAPVQYPPPPAPESPRRRKGRGQAAAPVVAPGPPPPMRYAMPTGQGMTAISAMKAEEQIQSGGTVLSQTFVKSAGK